MECIICQFMQKKFKPYGVKFDRKITFDCLVAQQSSSSRVVSFVANVEQIEKIARISRVGRGHNKELFGFQRSQIGNHINEIHDYLEGVVLPNAIILAFTKGVNFTLNESGNSGKLEVSIEEQQIGLIVDGQQRFSALSMLESKEFQVFVSAILCKDEDELQKHPY